MKNCVFAGTFDPITKGHFNIIEKCSKIYKEVFVVIGKNQDKTCFFSEKDRLCLTKKALSKIKNVQVVLYSTYQNDYTEFLKENDVKDYVRGIRNDVDLEFEEGYKKVNATLYPFIETVYIRPDKEYENISSTIVKTLIKENKDYTNLIPDAIKKDIVNLIKK